MQNRVFPGISNFRFCTQHPIFHIFLVKDSLALLEDKVNVVNRDHKVPLDNLDRLVHLDPLDNPETGVKLDLVDNVESLDCQDLLDQAVSVDNLVNQDHQVHKVRGDNQVCNLLVLPIRTVNFICQSNTDETNLKSIQNIRVYN